MSSSVDARLCGVVVVSDDDEEKLACLDLFPTHHRRACSSLDNRCALVFHLHVRVHAHTRQRAHERVVRARVRNVLVKAAGVQVSYTCQHGQSLYTHSRRL
jgi:hypothetical protein